MEDEIDINLSILLRAILNQYGQVRLSISDLSREIESDKEYRVAINVVDDQFLEISLEEK